MQEEVHFHLLPGVDDGPATTEASVELARAAVADGTDTIICTPHGELVDIATVPERVRLLQATLAAEGIPLTLKPGAEIRVGTPLTDRELSLIAQGPLGRRWVLLEAPLERPLFADFHAYADQLEARGYSLLIAHPERCAALLEPEGDLNRRLVRGARLQVNASSLTGFHGRAAQDAGFALVDAGRADVLASDAHGPDRPPLLTAAHHLIAARAAAA